MSSAAIENRVSQPSLAGWRYSRTASNVGATERPLPRRQILVGDALARLRGLPSSSVDCCVTSPPYYLLRNYSSDGQLGLESHVEDWVEHLRTVVQEVARVLKPTGSLWLNLGDSFSRGERYGAPPKSLLMAPERLILEAYWPTAGSCATRSSGPNQTRCPHSVRDRLNASHEYLYLLVRSRSYHFDLDEIRRPARATRQPRAVRPSKYSGPDRSWAGPLAGNNSGLAKAKAEGQPRPPAGS